MPSQGLFFSPRSRRDLKGFPRRDQESILSDIESGGGKDLYRLRTGDYRSIFRTSPQGIYILRIVPRKELERSLSRIWA